MPPMHMWHQVSFAEPLAPIMRPTYSEMKSNALDQALIRGVEIKMTCRMSLIYVNGFVLFGLESNGELTINWDIFGQNYCDKETF